MIDGDLVRVKETIADMEITPEMTGKVLGSVFGDKLLVIYGDQEDKRLIVLPESALVLHSAAKMQGEECHTCQMRFEYSQWPVCLNCGALAEELTRDLYLETAAVLSFLLDVRWYPDDLQKWDGGTFWLLQAAWSIMRNNLGIEKIHRRE